MIITIDGPTASGKSTLGRQIAHKLKIYYLNSGFLYRGLSYVLVNYFNYDEEKLKNPNPDDIASILDNSKFIYSYDGNREHIVFNGLDISSKLKTPEVDKYSSIISANKNVRAALVAYQREFAKKNDVIIDGRDCGSVVFPHADLKFFLTASVEVRALRWQKEMEKKGKQFSIQDCAKIITDRDERDIKREISPLIVPVGATIIDSSNLNADELLEKVLGIVREKFGIE